MKHFVIIYIKRAIGKTKRKQGEQNENCYD